MAQDSAAANEAVDENIEIISISRKRPEISKSSSTMRYQNKTFNLQASKEQGILLASYPTSASSTALMLVILGNHCGIVSTRDAESTLHVVDGVLMTNPNSFNEDC